MTSPYCSMEEQTVVIGSEVEIQSPRHALQDDTVLLETCGGGEEVQGEVCEPSEGGERDDIGTPERLQRFYFESDALVLKNNIDYQRMLKTLALLEAQKIQATKDLEQLMAVRARALRDPTGFVSALKNGTLEMLPVRQKVAELPDINWKSYMDSVERIVRQHSSVYQRTRRRGLSKETAVTTKAEATGGSKKSGVVKPPSYKQPWTAEEQTRLEELLRTYPPETIERRRYEKIAKALGTRTTQQVASHVQKYFIKLAKAGLPVPGRVPNITAYGPKGKKGGRAKRLNRPSTFFSNLAPRVFMAAGETRTGTLSPTGSGSYSPSPHEGDDDDEEERDGAEEEEEAEDSSDSDDSMLAEWVPTRSSRQTPISIIKCGRCQVVVKYGQYWECRDCPTHNKTLLCPDCINSDYLTAHHSQEHEMVPQTVPTSSSTADEDYMYFPQNSEGKYNYLDPNFYPAS